MGKWINAGVQRKHGASFEEGQTVFADDHGLLIHDPEHSNEEDRWLLLGMSSVARLLVAGNTARDLTVRERESIMRKSYDFSKAMENPYAKRVKKQVTIRIDENHNHLLQEVGGGIERSVANFDQSVFEGLRLCTSRKRLALKWLPAA